ncbi:MAG: DNA sulfur modification protein DndD [Candidatus Krumholzibacteriia bacterium]
MKITRVTFHNYRVYAGKQTISMAPPAQGRPVTLIGGMNGEGKTTLLEGIQLALYGRRSEIWQHNGSSYPDYLIQSIHRSADPRGGAMVEVEFEAVDQDAVRCFEVQRSWKVNGGGKVVEYVQVFINGQLDRLLSEDWNDQVERFIPARLAGLFFFDGEKIKHYADPQRSRELIERGVLSLLGIDLIDQLGVDLKALEARITKTAKKTSADEQAARLEKNWNEKKIEKSQLIERRATLLAAHDRQTSICEKCDHEYEDKGGRLYEQRLKLEVDQKSLQGRRGDLEKGLIELASGPLPLKMIEPLLVDCIRQMLLEQKARSAQTVLGQLEDQQKRVSQLLKRKKVAAATQILLRDFYEKEANAISRAATTDCYLHTSDGEYLMAKELLEARFDNDSKRAGELLREIGDIDSELQAIDRKLAAVPDDAALAEVQNRRTKAHHELAILEGKISQVDEALRLLGVHVDEAERAYHKHLLKVLGGAQDQADNARILDHAGRVRATLAELRSGLVRRRLKALEEVICEAYGHLMRKQGMVRSVTIDPDNYQLHLRNEAGDEILTDWLSAGERQLLVVAILWGMARASGRSLPVIIDTPLGRLDSTHRDNLVRHYFPHASHQVVLLSTDEEITGRTLKILKPSIGHSYRLVYDDKRDATTIEVGYFKEEAHAN